MPSSPRKWLQFSCYCDPCRKYFTFSAARGCIFYNFSLCFIINGWYFFILSYSCILSFFLHLLQCFLSNYLVPQWSHVVKFDIMDLSHPYLLTFFFFCSYLKGKTTISPYVTADSKDGKFQLLQVRYSTLQSMSSDIGTDA